jgi:hypothetical protein
MDTSMPNITKPLAVALSGLTGSLLSSVEFVQDYIQLRFDGPCLTAYTFPSFRAGAEVVERVQLGYCDAICGQIGLRVLRAEVDNERLAIFFEGGAVIAFSLLERDYVGPEAVQLTIDDAVWVA